LAVFRIGEHIGWEVIEIVRKEEKELRTGDGGREELN
jgi:hypothetical protein